MITSVPEEIVQAIEENRIIISPIPIGKPVYVIDICKCSPLHARQCKRGDRQIEGKNKAIYHESLGSDGRAFRCARIFIRPFDYAIHIKKVGKTVFERRIDALLMVAHMVRINQH